jgi:preprotein translocase subunit YajC
MTSVLNLILMAPANGQSGSNPMFSLIFMLLIIVVFYFFMIRPQVKRQKELTNFRNSLKKGDKVITTGGIYGKISEINDATIVLEIADEVRIKVDKSAVIRDPADMAPQK